MDLFIYLFIYIYIYSLVVTCVQFLEGRYRVGIRKSI